MKPNCVTTTIDLLTSEGGRFVAAGSRRGPLMHVWHESADGTVTRYEPDAPLRHWMHAFVGYPGHTVARSAFSLSAKRTPARSPLFCLMAISRSELAQKAFRSFSTLAHLELSGRAKAL